MLNEDSKTYVIAPFNEGSCFPFEVTDTLLSLLGKESLTEEESNTFDDCVNTIIEMTGAEKVEVTRKDDVLSVKVIGGPLYMPPSYRREVAKKATSKEIADFILKNVSKPKL